MKFCAAMQTLLLSASLFAGLVVGSNCDDATTTYQHRLATGTIMPTATVNVLEGSPFPSCDNTAVWTSGAPSVCQIRLWLRRNADTSQKTNYTWLSRSSALEEAVEEFTLTSEHISIFYSWNSHHICSDEYDDSESLVTKSQNYNTGDSFSDKICDKLSEGTGFLKSPMFETFMVRDEQATAMECSGTAYYFTEVDEVIDEAGIEDDMARSSFSLWVYPALMRNPNVDQIVQVWTSQEFKNDLCEVEDRKFSTRVLWKKGDNVSYPLYDADNFESPLESLGQRSNIGLVVLIPLLVLLWHMKLDW